MKKIKIHLKNMKKNVFRFFLDFSPKFRAKSSIIKQICYRISSGFGASFGVLAEPPLVHMDTECCVDVANR